MKREDIEQQLREILSLVLGPTLPDGELSRDTVPTWDSLRQVEIIFAVEEAFDVQLSEAEMADAASLAAFADIVEAHLAA